MYGIELRPRAEKEINDLPQTVKRRVLASISGLAVEPRPVGVQKLAAERGYRIRVGEYRVVFEIDDDPQTVTITRVRHRRDVYR